MDSSLSAFLPTLHHSSQSHSIPKAWSDSDTWGHSDPKLRLLPQCVHLRIPLPVQFWVQQYEVIFPMELGKHSIKLHPRKTMTCQLVGFSKSGNSQLTSFLSSLLHPKKMAASRLKYPYCFDQTIFRDGIQGAIQSSRRTNWLQLDLSKQWSDNISNSVFEKLSAVGLTPAGRGCPSTVSPPSGTTLGRANGSGG